VSWKRPYHHYVGKGRLVWIKGRGEVVDVVLLPREQQPGGNPWLFQPTDRKGRPVGDPVAIEDKDIQLGNRSTMSPSGLDSS
jgi:hypothetical protein